MRTAILHWAYTHFVGFVMSWLICFFIFHRNGVISSTEDGHEKFMQAYKDIFVKKPKKIGFPIHTEKRV